LSRFEAKEEPGRVTLSQLADACLEMVGSPSAGLVIVAQSAGLVGAALRRSPALPELSPLRSPPSPQAGPAFPRERRAEDGGPASLAAGLPPDRAVAGVHAGARASPISGSGSGRGGGGRQDARRGRRNARRGIGRCSRRACALAAPDRERRRAGGSFSRRGVLL